MQQTAQLLPTITLRAFVHASGVSNTSLYIFIESFLSFLSQVHWKLLAICLQEHSIALLTFSPVQYGGRGGQERAARNKSQRMSTKDLEEKEYTKHHYIFFHLQTTFSLSSCLMQWTSSIGSLLPRIHSMLATCTKFHWIGIRCNRYDTLHRKSISDTWIWPSQNHWGWNRCLNSQSPGPRRVNLCSLLCTLSSLVFTISKDGGFTNSLSVHSSAHHIYSKNVFS